jgi:hypothetical protein
MRLSDEVDVKYYSREQFARHDGTALVPKKTLKIIDNTATRVPSRRFAGFLHAKYLGALLIGYAAEKCDVQLIDDWHLNQVQR